MWDLLYQWTGLEGWRWRGAILEVGVGFVFYLLLACAITWPVCLNLHTIILGGGELGGWLWRQWWHSQEIDAIGASDLGLLEQIRILLSLGRFPETGNILDIIFLSYPLERWVGFPAFHNIKVLVILTGNGLCGYALARSFTDSRLVALAAGALAIVNPLVIQDINKTGLRQVLLWWLLLYPISLQRAQRTTSPLSGVLVGLCFVAVASFYWFYGLFVVMFSILHMGAWVIEERPPLSRIYRWVIPAALVALFGSLVFVSPYLSSGMDSAGQGGIARLPEVTFGLAFPAYDTIASAPLRPSTYQDNLVSSLHRTINSAWPADYVFNPAHGVLALPVVAFIFGVLPAFSIRQARVWLAVWITFYLGTLGPFLKIGAQKDTSEVVMLGDFVIRLPYALMFQVIPGMSRMFAPYRLASMMVVATVVLVAISLGSTRGLRRMGLGLLVLVAIPLQVFIRFDLGPLPEGQARPAMWRVPTQVSAFSLPSWYGQLDPSGWEGMIELPIDQQQDILCAYQMFHKRKVYRTWASPMALPSELRNRGGGAIGERLRWLARPDSERDPVRPIMEMLSREPLDADLDQLDPAALLALMEASDYRWLVLHERGYYLVDSTQGGVYYRHVVRTVSEYFGLEPQRLDEFTSFDWPGKKRNFPLGPAWVPWASREVHRPTPEMPSSYAMAVFDLHVWRDSLPPSESPVEGPGEELPVRPVEEVVPVVPPSG